VNDKWSQFGLTQDIISETAANQSYIYA
jgi:hypothetical protein